MQDFADNMNRRNLLQALAVIPALTLPTMAIASDSSLVYCKNKIGLTCTFTKELARDLMAVHHLNAVEVFSRKYGTTFHIDKSVSTKNGKQYLRFVLRTNDKRDGNEVWEVSEMGLINGHRVKAIRRDV